MFSRAILALQKKKKNNFVANQNKLDNKTELAAYGTVGAVAGNGERQNGGFRGRCGRKRLVLRLIGDSLFEYTTNYVKRTVLTDLRLVGSERLSVLA